MSGYDSQKSFDVEPFSRAALVRLLTELSPANSPHEIEARNHVDYLHRYLQEIGAKTIVVERNYIDRDYLEDFAAYYVKCFKPYRKTCARLHFFQVEFTTDNFVALLEGSTAALQVQRLQQGYCGFVVVKPLPQTIIGRTCLRTYPASTSRAYPAARRFPAHLFGISLQVDSTLPFQEQDNVVAACATSALWSVFQATALEFQHELMTPVEITRAATEHFPAETRMIPNRSGLSTAMMAHAIRSVGLEPVLLSLSNDAGALRANLYAYLSGRIPLIMGVRLIDVTDPAQPRSIGYHAVAVTGYNLDPQPSTVPVAPDFYVKAFRMNKVYVHDDQVGPFARMDFDGVLVNLPDANGNLVPHESLSTSWPDDAGSKQNVRALPTLLLIPLYHKIRIPYEDVLASVYDFDGFLGINRKAIGSTVLPEIEWDIRISNVNEVKGSFWMGGTIDPKVRARWLTSSMPRFLWRATGTSGVAQVFDILFDATDIHTSNDIHAFICYDRTINDLLQILAKNTTLSSVPAGAAKILRWIEAEQD